MPDSGYIYIMKKAFTKKELKIISDKDFYLTKREASGKMAELLGEVRDALKREIGKKHLKFPEGVDVAHGKISRGENYKNLPWMVLDFPKHFSRHSVIAFRTIVLWGNYFCFTFHLNGAMLEKFRGKILKNNPRLKKKNFYICISGEEWEHLLDQGNYISADELSQGEIEKIINEKKFLKLAWKLDLKDWRHLENFCRENFLSVVTLLFR
jgi:hypothetical protein